MLEAATGCPKVGVMLRNMAKERESNLYINKSVEFTCVVCGKKGIDYSGGSKKYCSPICASKGRRHGKGDPCPYNEGVECGIKNCAACGWNPTVSQDRMKKILGLLI